MSKHINLVGQKFGRLTVKSFSHTSKDRHSFWRCFCSCGKIKIIIGISLKRKLSKSCGCINKENPPALKHGMHKTSVYQTWQHMIQRCYSDKTNEYKNYGERNISVCTQWRKSFKTFFKDMGKKSKGLTLDRIDNNGNYTPDNCRWATRTEQANNKRNNILITLNNETHTVAEWSRIVGIKPEIIYFRIKAGWIHKKAVTTPINSRYCD